MNKIDVFLQTALKAAKAAGAIQREKYGAIHDIKYKGEADLVTEVDLACEAEIKRIIRNDWPDHAVLGEESGSSGTGDYTWIIDPLDGTTNYAHNYPHFCASVALTEKDRIIAGAVYDPMRDELFAAARGGGAFLNGKRVSVSACDQLARAMLVTGFPYGLEKRMKTLPLFESMLQKVQAIRRDGSAALDLCYVAAGRFEGFWEISLHAWDVAAGWLILEEAGGKITGFGGTPVTIYSEEILGTNGLIHREVTEIISSRA